MLTVRMPLWQPAVTGHQEGQADRDRREQEVVRGRDAKLPP
jgi:hypothetical protein